jgi:tetratricopeptide (TPR) repeat protein
MSSQRTSQTPPAQSWSTRNVALGLALVAALIFCAVRITPVWTSQRGGQLDERLLPLTRAQWDGAMQELDQRRPKAAVEFIRRSLGSESLQAQRAILQGRLLLDSGKFFAARQSLQEALDNPTFTPHALHWLGAASYAMGDTRAAESYWQDVLELNAREVEAHRGLAVIYYDRGAIDHAVHHLQQVTELAPDDARPYRLLGLIHKDYERYEDAVKFYQAALARQMAAATRDQVRREITTALIKTRDYETGLKIIEAASPTLDALVLQAECLVGLSRSEEAAPILEDVLQRDPDHFDALLVRAGIHQEQGEHTEAEQRLRRAAGLQPKDYLVNFRLAQTLRIQGQTEAATDFASRAEEIKLKRERFAQLHQDATANPTDAAVRYEIGLLAQDLDMPELALTWYKATLDLDPNHAEARQKLQAAGPAPQ